jgi:hypothetical protein
LVELVPSTVLWLLAEVSNLLNISADLVCLAFNNVLLVSTGLGTAGLGLGLDLGPAGLGLGLGLGTVGLGLGLGRPGLDNITAVYTGVDVSVEETSTLFFIVYDIRRVKLLSKYKWSYN